MKRSLYLVPMALARSVSLLFTDESGSAFSAAVHVLGARVGAPAHGSGRESHRDRHGAAYEC